MYADLVQLFLLENLSVTARLRVNVELIEVLTSYLCQCTIQKRLLCGIMFDARMYISYNHLAYPLLVFRANNQRTLYCTYTFFRVVGGVILSDLNRERYLLPTHIIYELYEYASAQKDCASWQ